MSRTLAALLALMAALLVAGCASGSLPGVGVSTEPPAGVAGAGGPLATGSAPKASFQPFAEQSGAPLASREVIANPTLAQVMAGGPLEERALGRADAPVTVIKYASMTCPYCRKFQAEVFPLLKRQYIETGKVRYILREFPIGKQSGLATLALRCAPADKHFALYDKLMAQQPAWVSQEVRPDPIFKVAQLVGMTRAQFDACIGDGKLAQDLNAVKERGRTLGVIGTPNFFINGRLVKSVLDGPKLTQMIEAELAGRGAVAAAPGGGER